VIHSIRKHCLALCWAICCLSPSNAQTINADGTVSTDNLITSQPSANGAEGTWSGIGGYSQLNGQKPTDLWGCCTSYSGSQPFLDTSTGGANGDSGQIHWSYGQSTVSQVIGVNQALANAGVGIQVNGYNWGYDLRNMNGGGNQNGTDTLTSYSFIKDSAGNVITGRSLTHDVQHEWQRFSGTETLKSPYDLSDVGQVGIQFTSRDAGFWAGYYGPQIKNVSLSLRYTAGAVDPCDTDPLYSTSCAGYAEAYKNLQCQSNPLYDQTCPGYAQAYFDNQCSLNPLYDQACPGRSEVITSNNLVPNPSGGSGWFGGSINNSFAINQALSHSGSGVMIHGFNWGYRALNFSPFGVGFGSSTVNVNIRDGDGTSLYSWSRNNTSGGENWYSGSYVFPQSRNNTTLGNFDFTATSSGWGYVDSMWAKAIFTPDSCSLDPLSSVLCTGYQQAFLDQQCSLNALYNPSCPGYTEAFAAMLAAAIPETTTTTATEDPVAAVTATTTTTSSTPGTTEDPTKDQAAVTTDVGGAEITTTGEVVASDGVPSDVKAAAKESASTEKKEESSGSSTAALAATPSAAKKPGSRVNALAIAQAAARETERNALSVASEAVAASLSDNANPADGIGIGSGLAIPGVRLLQGFGNDAASAQADQQAVAQTQRRTQEERAEDTQSSVASTDNKKDANPLAANSNVAIVEQKEDTAKAGPSVRRGGAVDGMSGGDMNALAAAPANFNDYLGKQMQDAQFYASKEIYRGQRNVDNARALRGLGTDRLHQQMVDQQYNISGQ
jgi:hypothetical protein